MKHKVVRASAVTDAVVHGSQVLEELMTGNAGKDVWAGSLYWSAAQFERLKALRVGEVLYCT